MSCRVIYLCSCHCIYTVNLWKSSEILQAECTCTFHFIYFLFVRLSFGTITVKKWNPLINYSGFLWISSTEQCNLRERNICDLSIGLWLLEMWSNAFSSENNNLEKPVFGYAPSENQFTTYFPKSHKYFINRNPYLRSGKSYEKQAGLLSVETHKIKLSPVFAPLSTALMFRFRSLRCSCMEVGKLWSCSSCVPLFFTAQWMVLRWHQRLWYPTFTRLILFTKNTKSCVCSVK